MKNKVYISPDIVHLIIRTGKLELSSIQTPFAATSQCWLEAKQREKLEAANTNQH